MEKGMDRHMKAQLRCWRGSSMQLLSERDMPSFQTVTRERRYNIDVVSDHEASEGPLSSD